MTATAKSIPFAEYLADPGINNSLLTEMGVSPLHFKAKLDGETKSKDTPALSIGRLIHTAVLEPELFESNVVVWQGGLTQKGDFTTSKNSTSYKEFAAQTQGCGGQVIDSDDQWLCYRIRRAVLDHPVAWPMLSEPGVEPELSIFWTHPIGVECKSRLDLLHGTEFVADLKTALDITPEGFGRAAHRYGYPRQAAFYQDAAYALTGTRLPYYIIAVEKCEPFDVAVYELGDDILAIGRSQYMDALRKVKECRESGIWPGVAPSVQTLELPPWAYTDEDEVLDWSGMEGEA